MTSGLTLDLRIGARTLGQGIAELLRVGAALGMERPVSVEYGLDRSARALAEIEGLEASDVLNANFGPFRAVASMVKGRLVCALLWSGGDPHALRDTVRGLIRVCVELAERRILFIANLQRTGVEVACMPDLPLVGRAAVLCFAAREDIEDDYEDVSAFLGQWTSVGEYYRTHLLTRGADCATDREFLEVCLPSQWALARAARPGRVLHNGAAPLPELADVYRAGAPRLSLVGYIAPIRTVEFTCGVDENEHIQGWEIDQIRWTLEARRLPSGQPVDAIRVVFLTREAAMRERRPLLDVGAKVVYMDGGKDVAIEE